MEQNCQLQTVLKGEATLQTDELSITEFDNIMKEFSQKLMKQVLDFGLVQKNYKDLLNKANGTMLSRIAEDPFKVDTGHAFSIKDYVE